MPFLFSSRLYTSSLRLRRRLAVTYILPSIFYPVTCFRVLTQNVTNPGSFPSVYCLQGILFVLDSM